MGGGDGGPVDVQKELGDRSVQIGSHWWWWQTWRGETGPKRRVEAAIGLSGSAAANSPIGSLLFDIWFVFATLGGGRMFSRTAGAGPQQPCRIGPGARSETAKGHGSLAGGAIAALWDSGRGRCGQTRFRPEAIAKLIFRKPFSATCPLRHGRVEGNLPGASNEKQSERKAGRRCWPNLEHAAEAGASELRGQRSAAEAAGQKPEDGDHPSSRDCDTQSDGEGCSRIRPPRPDGQAAPRGMEAATRRQLNRLIRPMILDSREERMTPLNSNGRWTAITGKESASARSISTIFAFVQQPTPALADRAAPSSRISNATVDRLNLGLMNLQNDHNVYILGPDSRGRRG